MTDARIVAAFDAGPVISFVQGEDRSVLITLWDQNTAEPVNLTTATVQCYFPQEGGGSVKRTSSPIALVPLNVAVVPASGGVFTLTDHGLVTGDPITFAGTGLPAPLVAATLYTLQTIDLNTFYVVDNTGLPVVLTTPGTAGFTFTNAHDIALGTPMLGQIILTLRGAVTQVINADCSQPVQVGYNISGLQRWCIATAELDVYPQTSA